MNDIITTDICVIGAGSGGLSVAAGAVQMGADVVLIEKARMGGDCLNSGCIPSKSLLAAAHAARFTREVSRFGVMTGGVSVDFGQAMDHVHNVIAEIAPHDSVERFEGLGCRVILDTARFSAPNEVIAGGKRIRARRFVIATGARTAVPAIEGLENVPYLTNETLFENRVCPGHLIIIGGGPVGVEMAEAHRELGAKVTLVEMGSILPKDDPELVEVIRAGLEADGISLYENAETKRVDMNGDMIRMTMTRQGTSITIEGTHLLVATGRSPNIDGLDLAAAGVDVGPRGIRVNRRLRTRNRRIYAIGDVTGGLQFTHMAGYDAGIVIRNVLFRLPASVNHNAVPWVTYTRNELAQVGLTEDAARRKYGERVRSVSWEYHENDRARSQGTTDGRIKVVLSGNGRILGAGIVGANAGELIGLWGLAISQRLKIGAIAAMIAPYPTLGEISKRAAGAWYTPSLFGTRTRRLVKLLLRLP